MITYKAQVNNISKDAIQALSNTNSGHISDMSIRLDIALRALNQIASLTQHSYMRPKNK